jgi:hypothetical protein
MTHESTIESLITKLKFGFDTKLFSFGLFHHINHNYSFSLFKIFMSRSFTCWHKSKDLNPRSNFFWGLIHVL